MLFLNQRKRENGRRIYFMTSFHERMCRTWGTNSRPLACQADTLPIELPHPAVYLCIQIKFIEAHRGSAVGFRFNIGLDHLIFFNLGVESWFICLLFWYIDELEVEVRKMLSVDQVFTKKELSIWLSLTVGFLLLQCSSGVVRHPRDLQVSVATRFCRVLIFASSQYLSVIYLFHVMIHWWVRKPPRGPNNCIFWAMIEAEGEVGRP